MLKQIRWRLAFSYTLVTTITLLIVEAGILAVLFVFLGSDLLPRRLVYEMQENIAPQVAEYLDSTPPRVVELRRWLGTLFQPSLSLAAGARGLSVRSAPLGGNGQLLVLDTQYSIIAAVPAVSEESSYLGGIPDLFPLFQRVLAGEENPANLYSRQTEGLLLAVVPIRGQDGEILGVLAAVFDFPTNFRLFALTLLRIAGGSLLLLIGPVAIVGTLAGFLISRPLSRRLQRLVQVAGLWKQGDLSARVGTEGKAKDELGQLALTLDQMATRLEKLLAVERQMAAVEERNRIARDLHDMVKQRLFAINMHVAALQSLAEQGNWEAVRQCASEVMSLAQQAQEEVTQALHNLRPIGLTRGFEESVREHLDEWSRQVGIPVTFRSVGGLLNLPLPTDEALLKILREALTNVARHSGATRVDVVLEQEEDRIGLTIADDGKGFVPVHAAGKGLGLLSMEERAREFGGSLTIESAPQQGTRLVVQIPLEDKK